MKNCFLSLAIVLSVICLAADSIAAIVIRTDVSSADGIQSSGTFTPGQSVTADIFMELTDTSSLSFYSFSLDYDATAFTLTSRNEFAFGTLAELDSTNGVNIPSGIAYRIDGSTIGTGPVGPFGPSRIASFTFATNPAAAVGPQFSIAPGFFEPGEEFFFSNSSADVAGSVEFFGGSLQAVSAVPEPTTISALAIAGVCGIWIRRRQKRG